MTADLADCQYVSLTMGCMFFFGQIYTVVKCFLKIVIALRTFDKHAPLCVVKIPQSKSKAKVFLIVQTFLTLIGFILALEGAVRDVVQPKITKVTFDTTDF